MTAVRIVEVVPPHGPLTWLFPELLRFDAPAAADAIDMREGLTVHDVLARSSACRLVLPQGPRGRATAAALRSGLRRARRDDVVVELATGPDTGLEAVLSTRSRPLGGPHLADARELEGIPFFLTTPNHPTAPVHTRLAPGWWGVLPGDVWPDAARAAWHRHLRDVRPDRALTALAFENHALAGIDLFTEAMTRAARLPGEGERLRPLVVGIDGIDGAGKSTHLDLLQRWFEARGRRVRRHKIYRHGVFHDTVTDMTRACAGGHALHLWPLQRQVKLLDSLKYWHTDIAPDLTADVLLFDRFVGTHLAAGSGRYHHDPLAREMLACFPRADVVFVLDLPVATALERIRTRAERTVDENPYMLARFRSKLLDFAALRGGIVLDATAEVDAIQQRMQHEVARAETRHRKEVG